MKGLREAFEKAIEADPYDIQTRREFSDWLDENTDEADLAAFHRETTREQIKEGEQFLKGFAVSCGGAFTDLIERLRKYVKEGTTFTFGDELGFEAEGRLDDAAAATTFWRFFSRYTGVYHMPKVETDGDDNPFTCCW